MKKLITLTLTITLIFTFTLTAFAAVPAKKTQIDWLISGAGGDVAALGGDPANGTGEFSYDFSSEDGSITGSVHGLNGTIAIEGCDEAYALAVHFTQHFNSLPREGHFHASHRLSAKSTEEFPIELGSNTFITFCYDADEDGGMMNAMELEHVVKLVFNLSNGGFIHEHSGEHSHGHDDDCDLDHDHDDCDDDHHEHEHDDCDDDHHEHEHDHAVRRVPVYSEPHNPVTGGSVSLLLPAVFASVAAYMSRKKEN
jgi:hypothetical protein